MLTVGAVGAVGARCLLVGVDFVRLSFDFGCAHSLTATVNE